MAAAEERAPVGRILGRYVLYDEIGSGGMASVHLGRLLGPNGFSRTVAIKRMHPQLARDPEFAAMFLEEARLAARVRHPNVVPIVDVVSLADELFIVMEHVQGESLSRLLRRERPPLGVALTIIADLLYGLHAAHEATSETGEPLGIVHRDVSPHNVMVGIDGVSRVLDFGLAKATSRSQNTQSNLRGKFAYISPEQVMRQPLDRRADVFTASIVMWETLTGERLFAADDGAASIARVLGETIAAPSTRVPELAQALDAIVMKGLERDPNARYASAREMALAIEAFGGLARPAEVGAWVARVDATTLRERAARLEAIERDSPGAPAAQPPTSGNEPTTSIATVPLGEAPPQATAKPRRTRAPLWLGVVGAALVAGAFALAHRARQPEPSPASDVASGAPVASVAPGAQPTPTPSAVPTAPIESTAAAAPPSASAPPPPRAGHGGAGVVGGRPHRASECDPPYYFDAAGVKRFKPKCI